VSKSLQESTIVTLLYFLKVVVVVIALMMKIMGFICSIFDGFLQISLWYWLHMHTPRKKPATVLSDVKTQIWKVDMSN